MKKFIICLVMLTLIQCGWDDIEYIPPNCPEDFSYENEIGDILQLSCADDEACHVSGSSAPGIYESYKGLEDGLKSGVFESRVLQIDDMPPFGWPDLTSEEFEKLECWRDAGYPEF